MTKTDIHPTSEIEIEIEIEMNKQTLLRIMQHVQFHNVKNTNLIELHEQAEIVIDQIKEMDVLHREKNQVVTLFNSLLFYYPSFPCSDINWSNSKLVFIHCFNKTQQFIVYKINKTSKISFYCDLKNLYNSSFTYHDRTSGLNIFIQPIAFYYYSGIRRNGSALFHSIDDNPALVTLLKCEWYNMGKFHRQNDKFATVIIDDDFTSLTYCENNELHRSRGLPAVIEIENDRVITELFYYFDKVSAVSAFEREELHQFQRIDEFGKNVFVCNQEKSLCLYFQLLFDYLFELYFMQPVLPKEIIINIVQYLFGDCSYYLLNQFYIVFANSLVKSRRNFNLHKLTNTQ